MADSILTEVESVARENSETILREWVQLQQQNLSAHNALLRPGELQNQSNEFLGVFIEASSGAASVQPMLRKAE